MINIGLVCSRKGSIRLENKGALPIGNTNLSDFAIQKLSLAGIPHVKLITNMEELKGDYVVRRPKWLDDPEVPVHRVPFWYITEMLGSNVNVYKYCILLFPTNPFITVNHIKLALFTTIQGNCNILRSYNEKTGTENGLYIFDIKYFLSNIDKYDTHTGAIFLPGEEIHNMSDYLKAKQKLEREYFYVVNSRSRT